MMTATKQTSADIFTSAKSVFSPPPGARCLEVTERVRATTEDVHPGWIRAMSILLKGMERLRLQELAEAARHHKEALPLNPACLSHSQ